MDLSNPASIVSGLLIGLIGAGLFLYGKKQQSYIPLFTGVALCIFPYFVASIWLLWAITAACLGLLYLMTRAG